MSFTYDGSPRPSVGYDWWSAIWSGFLRSNETGTHYFQCATSRGDCSVFINSVRVTSESQMFNFTKNTPVRILIRFSQSDYTGQVSFKQKRVCVYVFLCVVLCVLCVVCVVCCCVLCVVCVYLLWKKEEKCKNRGK